MNEQISGLILVIIMIITISFYLYTHSDNKLLKEVPSIGNKEFWIETEFIIWRIKANSKIDAIEKIRIKENIKMIENIWEIY